MNGEPRFRGPPLNDLFDSAEQESEIFEFRHTDGRLSFIRRMLQNIPGLAVQDFADRV